VSAFPIFSENKKVSHYIINNKGNHYKIGEQTFSDIPSIISFYKNHFLDTTTLTGAVSIIDIEDIITWPHEDMTFIFECFKKMSQFFTNQRSE
jgi:hypothetical protein